MSKPYFVPSTSTDTPHRSETEVARSRFITTVARVESVDEARKFLAKVRSAMADANHHVYAFRVGYGQSVIEGVSDDGEPTGTAGPPVLAILRGTDIGDTIIVITRYFGGTKLGTGGLVRAYSEATHIALNSLKTEQKIEKRWVGLDLPYPLYQPIKMLILDYGGTIEEETFTGEVSLMTIFPLEAIPEFEKALSDASAGRIKAVVLD
ncbi:MAG: YigZ family protein [Chitinophagaceae bacterium]|nr:YigZ family protein [Anaerolineae bacterium]